MTRILNHRASVMTKAVRNPALNSTLMVLFALISPFRLQAGEILAARLKTIPDKLYVNQPFEIRFELEVTAGSEMEDLRIRNFPNDPQTITVGRLETLSHHRTTRDGKSLDLFQFAAKARCLKPVKHTFTPTAHCMLVERRSTGFFSHWQSYPKQKQLQPFTLHVRALPLQGQPESFSGAVGTFKLAGELSQSHIRPGDIITLTLTLSGTGWLGDAEIPQPATAEHFKHYPPKIVVRKPLHIQTQQVFIPQTTQAVAIAAVDFTYFNPKSEQYKSTKTGPFPLSYRPLDTTEPAADIRVIETTRNVSRSTVTQAIAIARVNQTLRRALPALIACCGTLLAFFLFFMLHHTHRRLAWSVSAITFACGIGLALRFNRRAETTVQRVHHQTDLRFAPSLNAERLDVLSAGRTVIPLEHVDGWIRIDADGRRGWIQTSDLQHNGKQAPHTPEIP